MNVTCSGTVSSDVHSSAEEASMLAFARQELLPRLVLVKRLRFTTV